MDKKIVSEEYIDEIIVPHKDAIGKEYLAYRNHVQRVCHFTMCLKKSLEYDDAKKIVIASVYHDIAIWTDQTFDYLAPSIQLAKKYLQAHKLENMFEEISLIIDMHHKLSKYKGKFEDNVEAFRKADLIDLSKGWIGFGLDKKMISKSYEKYPVLGFRKILLQKFLNNLSKQPFKPLPMLKR